MQEMGGKYRWHTNNRSTINRTRADGRTSKVEGRIWWARAYVGRRDSVARGRRPPCRPVLPIPYLSEDLKTAVGRIESEYAASLCTLVEIEGRCPRVFRSRTLR